MFKSSFDFIQVLVAVIIIGFVLTWAALVIPITAVCISILYILLFAIGWISIWLVKLGRFFKRLF